MAYKNLSRDSKRLQTNKISPIKILNLAPTGDEVNVIMKVKRAEKRTGALDEVRQKTLNSPWRDSDLARSQLNAQTSAPKKLLDPIATIRKVNEILGRS